MFNFRTASKFYSLQNQKQRNSVQDKIDNSYLEIAIFSLWHINILEHIKIKATLAKEFHIQPSEIDKMPQWEYEYFIKYLEEMIKKENEDQEEVSKQYDPKQFKTPKLPSMPKMPKM